MRHHGDRHVGDMVFVGVDVGLDHLDLLVFSTTAATAEEKLND